MSAADEPVRYVGALQPDPAYFDGRLPHAAGAHHIQIYRGNRSRQGGGPLSGTYNHQPYVAWAHGRFHVSFLTAAVDEHDAPTVTLLSTSPDGYAWTEPVVLFPEYRLPSGQFAVMHQRTGFYCAPNGVLLGIGFYGICPDPQHSPNAGQGVGRVVRAIRADGTFGDIHFIRYSRHCGFDERNTAYPFHTAAKDPAVREACEALLADRLHTLQWWEEDRAQDGFFPLDPSAVQGAEEFHASMVTSQGAGKAFTWHTRPDGVVVGLWKNQYSALSFDGGRSWGPVTRSTTLRTTGAKIWGARTADGRYALVYNHSATSLHRYPMSALIGGDGAEFFTLLCVHGEVPARRYAGQHKDDGLQYFRGIPEGQPKPDDDLWVVYSTNKEDIWITRARVPLGAEGVPIGAGEFGAARALRDLAVWNFHVTAWATARLVDDADAGGRALELRDEDPWDYALAERVFPAVRTARIRFRLLTAALPAGATVEIEVQSQRHHRALRLRVRRDELTCDLEGVVRPHLPFPPRRWRDIELRLDCARATYDLWVDGAPVQAAVPFGEPAPDVGRIVFRTGAWRGRVRGHLVRADREKTTGLDTEDLPGSGIPVPAVAFRIADLQLADSGS